MGQGGHVNEPKYETVTGKMTDVFWLIVKLDKQNHEIEQKPEKLPKHIRGLHGRMKDMSV